jgi:hypothetical protein
MGTGAAVRTEVSGELINGLWPICSTAPASHFSDEIGQILDRTVHLFRFAPLPLKLGKLSPRWDR